MPEQTITLSANVVIYGLLLVVQFLLGWFVKTLFDRIRQLEVKDETLSDKIAELSVALPTHYVTTVEFRQMGDSIFSSLRRIEDKIDRKADKHDT